MMSSLVNEAIEKYIPQVFSARGLLILAAGGVITTQPIMQVLADGTVNSPIVDQTPITDNRVNQLSVALGGHSVLHIGMINQTNAYISVDNSKLTEMVFSLNRIDPKKNNHGDIAVNFYFQNGNGVYSYQRNPNVDNVVIGTDCAASADQSTDLGLTYDVLSTIAGTLGNAQSQVTVDMLASRVPYRSYVGDITRRGMNAMSSEQYNRLLQVYPTIFDCKPGL